MGADLGAAAALTAVAIVSALVTLVCWRRARSRQQALEQDRQEQLTSNAVATVARGHGGRLSTEARALARAWFLEQYTKTGNESDLQRVIELQERAG